MVTLGSVLVRKLDSNIQCGSGPHRAVGPTRDDFGPVCQSQPDLPNKSVMRIKRRMELFVLC